MNACLPRTTERRRLFCLSPQKPWGRSGAWRNSVVVRANGLLHRAASLLTQQAREAPWHSTVAACVGGWVGGWGGGWETTAPRRVGSCSSSSELGRLKVSLNVGSGSLSRVHDFSITCFPFQMLQLSEPCICCHSKRTQLRQQMLAFILTEIQIKIRAGQSCVVLWRTLLSLQWLSPTQWKFVLLERYVLWMAHHNLPWGTAPRTGATGTWQREREYKKKMHKCRKGSSFVSWLRRVNGVWRKRKETYLYCPQ